MTQTVDRKQLFLEALSKPDVQAQLSSQEFDEQFKRADLISGVLVKHITNEKGETLAHVEENPAFQDVYDYRGGEKLRHRLGRKREQVSNNFSARTHLFQKVYYANGLTQDDETKLRAAFHANNGSHETWSTIEKAALFVGFWPAAWSLARKTKPSSVFFFAGAYYGFYKFVVQPFGIQMLQNNLNAAAKPFAAKYGIKESDTL